MATIQQDTPEIPIGRYSPPPRNGDWLAGLPAWARIAFLLGVPSVIALGLSYALVQSVARDLGALKDASGRQETRQEAHVQQASDHTMATEFRFDDVLLVLRQICANTAPNAETRERCFQIVSRNRR